jgi:ABC-2 type transport system ATP-binding protein
MLRIQACSLNKSYSTVTAVQDISFTLHSGQILAILGPNGAGKSSLIRMLVGLTEPDAGQLDIALDGEHYARLPNQYYGYLPEDRGLYLDRSVRQNLTYVGQLRGMQSQLLQQRIDDWTTRFDLVEKRDDQLKQLSKGNQQKVQLISCLLHQPRLLILDEPFSGLDPINQELVVTVLRELQAQGMTIVLSAHQMALVERLADQMLLVNKGRVIAQGTVQRIMAQLTPHRLIELRSEPALSQTQLEQLPGVQRASVTANQCVLQLQPAASLNSLLQALWQLTAIERISEQQPSLHQLYLDAIEQHNVQLAHPSQQEA